MPGGAGAGESERSNPSRYVSCRTEDRWAGRRTMHRVGGIAMSTFEQVTILLDRTLGLNGRAGRFTPETPLLGAVPELDSMAVVLLLMEFEASFGIVVEDDEVGAEMFETVQSLVEFVDGKLGRVPQVSLMRQVSQ